MRSAIKAIMLASVQTQTTDSNTTDEAFADIPTTGRYFFADFTMGDEFGRHFLEISVGSQRSQLKVWVSTTEQTMGVVTNDCPKTQCDVPTKYDLNGSNSKSVVMN